MESTGQPSAPPAGRPEPTYAVGEAEPPLIGRDCKQCLTFLTRALDRVGSRPQSLLRALGVVSHESSEENKLYERTADGRGLLITLESKKKEAIVEEQLVGQGESQLLQRQETLDKVPLTAVNDTKKGESSLDGSVTLGRRFTNAATLLADGIRHSAEDILNNDGTPIIGGNVLTTSPAVESTPSDQEVADLQRKNVTTIAVECQACGNDTRAEAGARAFVRGPEPLSIVLCSNRLSSQREVDEVLVHELVHIYDVHSREMDLRDCRQLAYSEVRAAREAECNNSLTSFTKNICAKDKATVATRNMFPDQGRKCVCDVFNEAVNDMAPFESTDGVKGIDLFKCANGSSPMQPSDRTHAAPFGPDEPFPSHRRSDR